jgi:lipopolysaccharide biosynthesis glycosyltransferase
MISEADTTDPIAVLVSADGGYVRQLAVALRSLSDSAGSSTYLAFIVSDAFDADERQRLAECCGPSVSPRWMSIPDAMLQGVKLDGRNPLQTVFPLLAPEILSRDLTRVVCLDADVLVRRPLAELWQADLDAHPLGAVRDAYLPLVGFELPWRRLGLDPGAPYFNAGVMVMALDRWRTEGIAERVLTLMRHEAFPNDEQSALNAVLNGDWQRIAPEWNTQSHHLAGDSGRAWAFEDSSTLERAVGDPAIVHFCAGDFGRPWNAGSSHPFRDDWFESLDRTPWAGWRPRRHWVRGALHRARRAGGELLGHRSAR